MSEELRDPVNERQPESELEQLIGTYLSEYLELEERLGVRPPLEEFEKRVPEHLRRQFRAAVEALLWLEPLRSATSPSAPDSSGAAGQPEGGEQFGDYVLCRRIGAGTMGTVYEAVHRTLKRRVALKVMAPWLASQPGYRERFLREAQAAARLHHTNIAPVFEVGEHAGRLFYAMHYVDGVPLDRLLALIRQRRRDRTGKAESEMPEDLPDWARSLIERAASGGGVPHGEVIEWGIQVASALQHAHACGVVHRDIKPSNLILDADGRVWLVDFGLAALFDDPSMTRPGAMVGTPRYMSPEQARGEPVGPAADVYALGAVLYEALCLRPLITGESVDQVLQQLRNAGPRPTLPAHVPPSLRVVLLRCVEPDPDRRYSSASELLEDLRRVARGEPVRGMRFVFLRRALATCRRYKGTVVTAAALSALAVGLAIWRQVDVTRAWRRAEQSARKAEQALKLSRMRLGEALLADVRNLLSSNSAGRVPLALDRLREARPVVSEFPELQPRWRNLLAQAAQTPDLISQSVQFPPVADPVAQLLGAQSAPVARPVAIVDVLPEPNHDGLLVITSDGVLAEIRGDSARTIGSVPPGAGRLVGADAHGIWVAGGSGVWRLSRDNGAASAVLDVGPPEKIAVHERGGAAVLAARSLWVIRNGTRFTLPLPGEDVRVQTLAWDREGKRLFVGDASGRLLVYSVALRRRVAEVDLADTAGAVAHVTACAVLPAGAVVVGLSDGSVRLLSPELRLIDTFRGHRDPVRWVVPFRDGVRLLSCDGREFLLWSMPTGDVLAPRLEPESRVVRVVPDPDQDEVVYRTEDKAWHRLQALPLQRTVRVCKASDATLIAGAVSDEGRVAWVDSLGRVGIAAFADGGFDIRVFPLVAPASTVIIRGGALWARGVDGRELHWIENRTGRHHRWSVESEVGAIYALSPTQAIALTENGSAYLVQATDGLEPLDLGSPVHAGCEGRKDRSGKGTVYLLLPQGGVVRVDANGRPQQVAQLRSLKGASLRGARFPWLLFETEAGVWVANCRSGWSERVVTREGADQWRVLAASMVPAEDEASVLYRLVLRPAALSEAPLTLLSGFVRDTSGGLVREQVVVGLWPLLIPSVRAAAFSRDGKTLCLFGGPRERGRMGPGLIELWDLESCSPEAMIRLPGSTQSGHLKPFGTSDRQ